VTLVSVVNKDSVDFQDFQGCQVPQDHPAPRVSEETGVRLDPKVSELKVLQVRLESQVPWVLKVSDFLGLRENEENPDGLVKEDRQEAQDPLDPQDTANFVIPLLNKPIGHPQRRDPELFLTICGKIGL